MKVHLSGSEGPKEKGSRSPSLIVIICGILIVLLAIDLTLLGESNRASVDMCIGCHGNRYYE